MEQVTLNLYAHKTQREKILIMLEERQFVPTSLLRLFAYQYNARIKELRTAGHKIISCYRGGVYGFMLEAKA